MSSSSSFIMSSATSAANESPFHSIVKYIDDYMDLVDNVPNDIARQITQLHENNHRYHQLLSQLETTLDIVCGKTPSTESKKRNAVLRIQRCLIEIQEIADEKLLLIQSILDQLDGKARQLDFDYRAVTLSNTSSSITNSVRNVTLNSGNASSIVTANHSSQHAVQRTETTNNTNAVTNTVTINATNNEVSNKESPNNGLNAVTANGTAVNTTSNSCSSALSGKRASARRNTASRNNPDNAIDSNLAKRSVKRGVKGTSHKDLKRTKGSANSSNCLIDNSPPPLYEGAPIDPDEPTYCLCEQVSFGEMICCDNSGCVIEWFHFSCVSLNTKPKGKWYCPHCRGERSNIPKK